MRLLFVCTGNVCRSPVAERTARALLDATLGASAAAIGTASAGTRAVVGAPVHPLAATALVELGGESEGFSARQLTADDVRSSDLVLTMTRRHRDAVLLLAPGALRRTFTLAEAAALLSRVAPRPPGGHPRPSLVDALNAERALRTGTAREEDDIADPIGLDAAGHRATARRIQAAVEPLVEALCGWSDAPGATALDLAPLPAPPAALFRS
ncbi:protein-tyrosine phosphatase [Blastococcus aggregatus]|uniref:Protein-tyrosine phosphatase n=1 Tax=Blastococcus aggregatus TaxID=38502 RepID=A0A285V5J0_9ACTN|nr:low molecular weight phosphatase family protein [Blastococcus aggregatus]SOC47761.1 protein-tyrosine phosphatase [Blastococcus aggregatus]